MNDFNYFQYYNLKNAEQKLNYRNLEYIVLITNMLTQMFEIDGMTNEQSSHLIRTILNYGSAYVKKTDNGYIICGGNYVGLPDIDTVYPKHYICTKSYTDENGNSQTFRFDGIPNDTDETVCYLIPQLLPCEQIYRFASQFAEIDTSLVNNIQFARIAPIGVVGNNTVKERFEKILKGMFTGELINTLLTPINPIKERALDVTTIDLSDGNYSEKIQYLSMYHEQMISRLCKLYGISYTYISKQANITNDELHNSDDFCCIYPLMYKSFLNECLNKIGLHAEFTKPWKWIDLSFEQRFNTPDTNDHGDDPESVDTVDGKTEVTE